MRRKHRGCASRVTTNDDPLTIGNEAAGQAYRMVVSTLALTGGWFVNDSMDAMHVGFNHGSVQLRSSCEDNEEIGPCHDRAWPLRLSMDETFEQGARCPGETLREGFTVEGRGIVCVCACTERQPPWFATNPRSHADRMVQLREENKPTQKWVTRRYMSKPSGLTWGWAHTCARPLYFWRGGRMP